MKSVYKKLLKIKNPVLIEVRHVGHPYLNKYRILYPDGTCEYSYIAGHSFFYHSCFQESTLDATVKEMESYDTSFGDSHYEIINIQEIK